MKSLFFLLLLTFFQKSAYAWEKEKQYIILTVNGNIITSTYDAVKLHLITKDTTYDLITPVTWELKEDFLQKEGIIELQYKKRKYRTHTDVKLKFFENGGALCYLNFGTKKSKYCSLSVPSTSFYIPIISTKLNRKEREYLRRGY